MKARILVIEDDHNIRLILREFLTLHDYEVEDAADGAVGLVAIKARRPDVVLLDLMMPVLDGWSFRREQLADRSLATVPTIVITASYTEMADLKPLKVEHVIRKPLDFDALLATIEAQIPAP